MTVIPVVLCGGSGTRLWPLSRPERPKQLLPLGGAGSLLADTLRRCAPLGPPVLVGSEAQRFVLCEEARRAGVPVRFIGEPDGRNTAAAAVVAALDVQRRHGDALMLIAPADHRIDDPGAFRCAVERGAPAAREGRIVVFGIRPDAPHTGYGWVEPAGEGPVCPVRRFVEKPERRVAERLLRDGLLWNAGIFLTSTSTLLAEVERLHPALLAACRRAHARGREDGVALRLDVDGWAGVPTVSFDVAVMERTERASVVPVDMGWSDLGSYAALHAVAAKDEGANALAGDAVQVGSRGCYLHGDGVLVAGLGLRDLVVVGTTDAVLVAPLGASGAIPQVLERLGGRREVRAHPRTERPWGRYRVVDRGPGFQVKRLVVRPGERLSLQRHRHRDEHWVVVGGRGWATIGEERRALFAGDHLLVPRRVPHCLENDGAEELTLVEVQVGDYLGEDDIERIEDPYGRADG